MMGGTGQIHLMLRATRQVSSLWPPGTQGHARTSHQICRALLGFALARQVFYHLSYATQTF
jgi:hypothetical protein